MNDTAREAGLTPPKAVQIAPKVLLAEQFTHQLASASPAVGEETLDALSSRKSVADTIAAIRLEFGTGRGTDTGRGPGNG